MDKGESRPGGGGYHPSLMLSPLSFVFIYSMYTYKWMSSWPLFSLQLRRLPGKVKSPAPAHRIGWWEISEQNSSVCTRVTLHPLCSVCTTLNRLLYGGKGPTWNLSFACEAFSPAKQLPFRDCRTGQRSPVCIGAWKPVKSEVWDFFQTHKKKAISPFLRTNLSL